MLTETIQLTKNLPKVHDCNKIAYGNEIKAVDTEGGFTWFLILSIDSENDLLERSDPIGWCPWCGEKLIDFRIVNTRGEHPPNDQGEYLCNGNCGWDTCNMSRWKCESCGYIECDTCNEAFLDGMLDKLKISPDNYNGPDYCRGCKKENTLREFIFSIVINIQ